MRENFTILFLLLNLGVFAQNHELIISKDAVQKDVKAIEFLLKANIGDELNFYFSGDESEEKFKADEVVLEDQDQTIHFSGTTGQVSFHFSGKEFVEAKLSRNSQPYFISYDAITAHFHYGEMLALQDEIAAQNANAYHMMNQYSGLSDNDQLIQVWGSEAGRNITNSSTIENRDYTPIFDTSYDWHSSVNGHFAAVTSGRFLNNNNLMAKATNQYTNSSDVSREAYNSSYKSTFTIEKTYGYPWLLLLGAELKNNQPQAYNNLKLLLDAKYNTAKNTVGLYDGSVNLRSSYYYKSLTSGYKNYNFVFLGIYTYAEAIGDTNTMNAIKNYLNAYTSTIDWGNSTSTDFFEGKAIAAVLYQKVGLTYGRSWNNLSAAYQFDSSSFPSDLRYYDAHSLGRLMSSSWGYWAMYEVTGEQRYLSKYTEFVNGVYQELKKRSSNYNYYAQEGHWIPYFGSFALSMSQARILPIDLISFTAEKKNQNAILSWSITKTADKGHFVIEQSFDGNHFTAVKTIISRQSLTYKELLPLYSYSSDFVYFRLRAIDNGGIETVSNLQKITLKSEQFDVYPTVVHRGEQIHIDSSRFSTYQIISLSGQVVLNGDLNAGQESVSTAHLSSGIYVLVCGKNSVKIIVE